MAPNLKDWQRKAIHAMIGRKFKNNEIARIVGCSTRTITTIRSNLRDFGSTIPPSTGIGRRRSITPPMLEALREHLTENPSLYLNEMVDILRDEFGVVVAPSTVSNALARMQWSKKVIRRVAKEQNPDLRDLYLYNLLALDPEQVVYVDESGCDKRVGFRRTGWSPIGVTPVQTTRFHRGRRYHILPAYTQDGVLLSRVYQGSTDSEVFEDFIEQLLCHCGRWPEPRSVLIMDNASFHHTERIKQMCNAAGVKLMYLPPYSPDLNPIEEFFSELKAFVKRNWQAFEDDPDQGFGPFLEWCVDVVGSRESSARGHFRHAGWVIEEHELDERSTGQS